MTQSERLEDAADWFDRLDELNEQEKKQLAVWMTVPENRQAFTRIANALGQPEVSAAAFALSQAPPETNSERPKKSRQHLAFKRPLWFSGAASIAIVAIIAAYVKFKLPSDIDAPTVLPTAAIYLQNDVLKTAVAKQGSTILKDGSVVYLNGDSQLTVNHSKQWREVSLDKGQVYFDVAHEPERPFVINIDSTRVQVVGTSFDIDRLKSRTVIRVYEGVVKVMADKTLMLLKGEGVILEEGAWSHTFKIEDEQLPAWRTGWLDVSNEPLASVIAHFSRHLEKRIEVSELGNITVTGRFNLVEPEKSLKLLASSQGLTISEKADKYILTPSQQ